METRSMAAARRTMEAAGASSQSEPSSRRGSPSSDSSFVSTMSTSASTVVHMSNDANEQSDMTVFRSASRSSRTGSRTSSKRVRMEQERLRLQEEALQLRLQLNETRHQQLLLEKEDDATDLSSEDDGLGDFMEDLPPHLLLNNASAMDPVAKSPIASRPMFENLPPLPQLYPIHPRFLGGNRPVQFISQPPKPDVNVSQPPRNISYTTTNVQGNGQSGNIGYSGQGMHFGAQPLTYPSQPPPYAAQAGSAFQPPQQSVEAVTITQLVDALKQVVLQPQQQVERFMARQTLGKDLPMFGGNVEDWPAFYSYYSTSTRECAIPNSQNLIRLQKCLTGQAKESVRALLVADRNVPEIIRVLEKNFGQPAVIIRALMDKVRKTIAPTEGAFDSIVQYGDCVRNLVRTIEALGKPQYLMNPQLMEELEDKLPANLRLQWAQYVVNMRPADPNLSHFVIWLENVTDAAIVLNRNITSITSEANTKETSNKGGRGKGKVTTGKGRETAWATDTEEQEKNKFVTCVYCSKPNHGIADCRGFLKLEPIQRDEWINSKFACPCCLKLGHRAKTCWNKKSCEVDGCKQLHHKLLHFHKQDNNAETKIPNSQSQSGLSSQQTGDNEEKIDKTCHISHGSVLMRILPVEIKGPKGVMTIHAVCDDASTVSLLDKSVLEELGISGQKAPLTLQWTDGTTQRDPDSQKVQLGIREPGNGKWYGMYNVRSVKKLEPHVQSVPVKKFQDRWKHLRHINVATLKDARPRLLIGEDHIHLIVAREVREGAPNAPMATRTKLGWIVHGPVPSMRARVDTHFMYCGHEKNDEDKNLHQIVKDSFSLDAIGVTVNPQSLKSKNDIRAEKLMEELAIREDGRFVVPLLWKSDQPTLPYNYNEALRRLNGIERKMDKNPEFGDEYCKKIQYYLDMGYARKMSDEEAAMITPKTWFLPHFFAYHPNKPGKPRFVFDAAAECKGQSLNKNLMSGPDELKSLPGVLMKFREKSIAFTADIREMFHQVGIRSEDQDAQRFLWREKDRSKPPAAYVMKVMIFGASCSPFAAQYAKNRNALEHEEEYPEAADAIINNHYVDDLAGNADDEDEATKVINDIIYVHARGGFEITKWSCSSEAVLAKIPECLRATEMKKLELRTEIPMERVLGLMWDPFSDCFQFATSFNKVKAEIVRGLETPTKREVLKTVMSIFDPLGLISHFVIKAKIIYQEIWKNKTEWDEAIEECQAKKWKDWVCQIPAVASLKIPRHYFQKTKPETCHLHVFCDASHQAYAAVAYVVYEHERKSYSQLVMAKSRVAPLKVESVPRLELQAALLGVRLATFIQEEQKLKFTSVTYWTDAKTVLLRLRSDANRYKQFVAYRLGEILEKSELSQWRWLSTKLNVADEATRSIPAADLNINARWFTGPSFLREPESEWPLEKVPEVTEATDEDLELKKEFCNVTSFEENWLPDISRFSMWLRLIRTTAYLRKFAVIKFGLNGAGQNLLTVHDVKWAQLQWWKKVQRDSFPVEYACLKNGNGLKAIPKDSKIAFLSPFMDSDGVMRVTSRTKHSPELNRNQMSPIILDPTHSYTKMLVMQYHLWARHQGQEMVVNELKQKYWILRVRSLTKSTWNSCLVCKHRKSIPIPPQMAPLPAFRVTKPVRPFTHCGLDYFGPLVVTKFRRHEKRWGALFTCMHTRAVHLELVDSLTADSVIMAMTRMASYRGWPQKMYSDNGTNFRGAAAELNRSIRELDQAKIVGVLVANEVEWHFIPPATPHFGGTWERMVRSVKRTLDMILKERAPKEEVMRTLFAEAVNIVNSRPLCYVPTSDPMDPEVITPNCFLFGTTSAAPVLGEFGDHDLCLRKQWRYTQRLADHFWRRWVHEYLPTLVRRTKWMKSGAAVAEGDIVVIADDDQPRNVWPKGIIEKVFPGKDGIVRVADVRTRHGTFRRPVVKLCVLGGIRKDDGVPSAIGTPGGTMLANAVERDKGNM